MAFDPRQAPVPAEAQRLVSLQCTAVRLDDTALSRQQSLLADSVNESCVKITLAP